MIITFTEECMCAAVAILWSVRDFPFCVTQHLQRKKKSCWQTRGALNCTYYYSVPLCSPGGHGEKLQTPEQALPWRHTRCLHHLIFTANCSNLIWCAYHFWGVGGESGGGWRKSGVWGPHREHCLLWITQETLGKTQHEYMEELSRLNAVIIALWLLPRWISRHSKSIW